MNSAVFPALFTVWGVFMFFAIVPLWKAFMGNVQPPFGLSQESMHIILRVFAFAYTLQALQWTIESLVSGS